MWCAPDLPRPRGPNSAAVIEALLRAPGARVRTPSVVADPLDDDDLHLALYLCYELHYRGWSGVDAAWEWDARLLAHRHALEEWFLAAVRDAVSVPPVFTPGAAIVALQEMVAGAGGPSVSSHIERAGTLEELRELAIHRSAYQLKEADPHTWAIPRLPAGRAKSALLRLQYDEYGLGKPGQSHAELFADTMGALGLDPTYGRYLDAIPGVTLATVNLLSLFGLRRALVGACIGHLAVFEMTSVVPMGRYASALRRVTGRDEGAAFYDVHVAADAVHEVIAIEELVPGLLEQDSALANDVEFGAAALLLVERRLAEHLMGAWTSGRSTLRRDGSAALAVAS